jgi:hypothetical protein
MSKGKFNKELTLVIAEICEKLYESGGVTAVTHYANKIKLAYGYCIPCNGEMPIIQYKGHNDCACCGNIIATKIKLKKENFLEWYFTDLNDFTDIGQKVFKDLLSNNRSLVTVNSLFKDCQYIPNFICEENDFDENKEFLPIAVELID